MKKLAFILYSTLCILILSLPKDSFGQNVGIGTTTPEGLLHVKGTNWTKAILENNTGDPRGYFGIDNNGTITIGANAYWNGSTWVYPNTGSSLYMLFHRLNHRYEFRVRPDGGSQATAMTIDTGSNVTIGGSLVIDQENGNTGAISTNALRFGSSSGEGIGSKRNSGTGQYGLDFYTGNINRVTIANNGNVGINVTNPSSKLELRGALGFSSTTKRWEMNYDSTNGYFYIDEFGAARRLSIKNGGNVGINTTNPQTTLDVNGDVNIENRLLLNNSTGNNGQVLVSNGNAAPNWQNVAYSNNDRFYYKTDTGLVSLLPGLISLTPRFRQVYANSTAINQSSLSNFHVNKSGLYSIQLDLIFNFVKSAPNGDGVMQVDMNINFPSTPTYSERFYAGSINNYLGFFPTGHMYTLAVRKEWKIYLPAGTSFSFFTSGLSGSAVSSYLIENTGLSINLISE